MNLFSFLVSCSTMISPGFIVLLFFSRNSFRVSMNSGSIPRLRNDIIEQHERCVLVTGMMIPLKKKFKWSHLKTDRRNFL